MKPRLALQNPTPFAVARLAFVLLAMVLGAFISIGYQKSWWTGSLAGAAFGGLTALLDMALRNFSVRGFSHATMGLMVGVLCAWLVNQVGFFRTKGLDTYPDVQSIVELMVYLALGFIGMMLALRSNREEFSLLIPYVRFRQDAVRDQPLLVDSNVIIDGRIPRICASGFLNGAMVVPRVVINELHQMADASDPMRQERGQRGLECLSELQKSDAVELSIHEEGNGSLEKTGSVEARFVSVARMLGARILTNDANLAKVARLQGVPVLNLRELAKAMRPVLNPGDHISVALVKEGKDPRQAIGYLPDGTMIVVNEAAELIGTTQDVVVGSSLQTSAGRLFFAEIDA